jgi:acyl-coenzyme A thioesterase PaaI-like protein
MLKPMFAPPCNASSSGLAKVGLALATVFAIGTTSTAMAFQSRSAEHTRPLLGRKEESLSALPFQNTRNHWAGPTQHVPLFRATAVQCEAQRLPQGQVSTSTENVNGNGNGATSSTLSEELGASALFQRMNPPSRMDLDSHAVSQLLQPDKIARYEVYKKRNPSVSSFTDTEDATNMHVVTALVDFGTALDGHPKVVHGGILALILDDVFGFSFEALGAPMAVTANLNLNYRAPTPGGTSVIIQVQLERRENRKLYFQGQVTSLDGSLLYAESTCLYIIPRSVWETMEHKSS